MSVTSSPKLRAKGVFGDGWTLYAVGNMMYTSEARDATPYFQMVFVRKERTAEESGGEGFEMVEEKKELKDEDFRVE